MAFRVEITLPAQKDANAILEWLLSQHAGETGLRWFRRMDEAIKSLANLPGRCKLAPENRSVPFEMRQLLYGHKPHLYRILFTIEGDGCTCYASGTVDENTFRTLILSFLLRIGSQHRLRALENTEDEMKLAVLRQAIHDGEASGLPRRHL